MDKLETLIISSNILEEPVYIPQLPSLKHLDISYNKLTDLGELAHMEGLEYVNITGNRLSDKQISDFLSEINCAVEYRETEFDTEETHEQ